MCKPTTGNFKQAKKQVAFSECIVSEVRKCEIFDTHQLIHNDKFFDAKDYRRFRCEELMNKIREVEETIKSSLNTFINTKLIDSNCNGEISCQKSGENEHKKDQRSKKFSKDHKLVCPTRRQDNFMENNTAKQKNNETISKTSKIFRQESKSDCLLICPRRRISLTDAEINEISTRI